MLSLLSCSVRIDEFDPYAAPPSPLRQGRASRSLSFIKPSPPNPKKWRRASKLKIGVPVGFRHETHIGMEVAENSRLEMWDAARWQQELDAGEKIHTPKNSTLASDAAEPSTPVPSTPVTSNLSKRNSIPPQKRKPVPSIITPDTPAAPSFVTLVACNVPLPPSPTDEAPTEVLPRPPPRHPRRPVPSADARQKLYVTQTVELRWDSATCEIEKALGEGAVADEPPPQTCMTIPNS